MANLTSKQENFCQNIVKGKTQYEAYCDAYDTKTTDRNTIDCNASQLMLNTQISQRIEELRKPAVDNTIRTLDTILKEINELKNNNLNKDDKLVLDCLKHEAKLMGFEVIKSKVEHSGYIEPSEDAFNEAIKKIGK